MGGKERQVMDRIVGVFVCPGRSQRVFMPVILRCYPFVYLNPQGFGNVTRPYHLTFRLTAQTATSPRDRF